MDSTDRGIRYPEGQDKAAWPDDFEQLADDINTLVPRYAAGSGTIPGVLDDRSMTTIEFPEDRFTEPPIVVASPLTVAPGSVVKGMNVAGTSASSFDAWTYRSTSSDTSVQWVAFQPDSGGVHGFEHPQYAGASNTLARPTRYLNSLQAAVRSGMATIDAGVDTINPSGTAPSRLGISFTSGRFTQRPILVAGFESAYPGEVAYTVGVASITTDGADLWFNRSNSNATNLHWVAIQPSFNKRLWTPGGAADLPAKFQEFAENVEKYAPRIDVQDIVITPVAGEPTSGHVEFTPGVFTKPPVVVTTINNGAIYTRTRGSSVSNATATGVDVYMYRTNANATRINVIAVQV